MENCPYRVFTMPSFSYDEMWLCAVKGTLPYSQFVREEISLNETSLLNQAQVDDIEKRNSRSDTFEMMFYHFGGCMRFHCAPVEDGLSAIQRSLSVAESYTNDIILPNTVPLHRTR